MNKNKLKQRLFYKEARPLKDRASIKTLSRRENNFVKAEEDHPNDEFETFFDFEEDLTDMPSSSEQFKIQEELESLNPVILEEQPSFFTVMEEQEEIEDNKTSNSLGIILDELNNCEFSELGKECLNVKAEGSIYCEKHKQELINKIKKEKNIG